MVWLGGTISADIDACPNAGHQTLGSRKLEARNDLLHRLKLLVAKVHRALGGGVGERSRA
jgi:hypothetical protein